MRAPAPCVPHHRNNAAVHCEVAEVLAPCIERRLDPRALTREMLDLVLILIHGLVTLSVPTLVADEVRM